MRDNLSYLIETICCDPSSELSGQNSLDEGSQHVVLCRINKNYPLISYSILFGGIYQELGLVVQN